MQIHLGTSYICRQSRTMAPLLSLFRVVNITAFDDNKKLISYTYVVRDIQTLSLLHFYYWFVLYNITHTRSRIEPLDR